MEKDNRDVDAGAAKFDAGKIRMDLVPPESTMAAAAVFTYGAAKYADWNWAKGLRTGRVIAALQRHMAAYQMGEDDDQESGLPHTWHMHCCTAMLVGGALRDVDVDDREVNPEALQRVLTLFENVNDPTGDAQTGA